MIPRPLSPAEAASRLGISTRSLERWRAAGFGPAFLRVSAHRVVYQEADLTGWLASRVRQCGDAPV